MTLFGKSAKEEGRGEGVQKIADKIRYTFFLFYISKSIFGVNVRVA